MTTNECNNCGAPVKSTRPNKTDASFCSLRECQAAKQRFFRKRKKEGLYEGFTNPGDATRAYIADAIHGRRVPCRDCGLEDAVLGWLHRATPGGGPCNGVGSGGKDLVAILWYDVVHPERAP
jgi:hypothetical protein